MFLVLKFFCLMRLLNCAHSCKSWTNLSSVFSPGTSPEKAQNNILSKLKISSIVECMFIAGLYCSNKICCSHLNYVSLLCTVMSIACMLIAERCIVNPICTCQYLDKIHSIMGKANRFLTLARCCNAVKRLCIHRLPACWFTSRTSRQVRSLYSCARHLTVLYFRMAVKGHFAALFIVWCNCK